MKKFYNFVFLLRWFDRLLTNRNAENDFLFLSTSAWLILGNEQRWNIAHQ